MPEWTKGTACKAVKPRVQIPPDALQVIRPLCFIGWRFLHVLLLLHVLLILAVRNLVSNM